MEAYSEESYMDDKQRELLPARALPLDVVFNFKRALASNMEDKSLLNNVYHLARHLVNVAHAP